MAKITPLADVGSLANTTSARAVINANSDSIEEAFENTLSRDGSSPNQMEADIDLNDHFLLNVADPVNEADAVNLRSVRPLVEQFAAEIVETAVFGTQIVDSYTATPGQTDFALSEPPGSIQNVSLFIDELAKLPSVDFTLTGTTLQTLVVTPALTGGETVLIRYAKALPSGIELSQNVTYTPPITGVDGTVKSYLDDLQTTGSEKGASLVATIQDATGAVARTVEGKLRERLSALDFIPVSLHANIANRTGVVDLAAYINAGLTKATALGCDLELPPGLYRLASGLVLNEGADTDDYSPRAALLGHGASNTVLDFANGDFVGVTIQGGTGSGTHANFRSGGFGLRKADRLGIGLLLDNVAYGAIRDIQATGWGTGVKVTDCLTSEFNRVTLRNNDVGFIGEFSDGSFPNALSFDSCEIGINRIAGMRILGGGSISLYGGAVEGNGWVGGGVGYGIYIEDAGAESAVGFAVHGTYFEANEGVADVWIKNNVARSSVHDLTGATFNRVGNVSFVTNNVRVENLNTGDIKLSLKGCGFKGFGAYTPNAGRQYITSINTGGGTVRINRLAGNYYQSATENAEMSGISDSESSIPIMWGRFSLGVGVVNKVATKNVGTVVYNAVGDYTINLEQGVTGASYAVFPGQNHSAFSSVQAFKASDTAITVKVFDAAGAAMDPAGFSLKVYALR